ncbi:MAG: transcription elongation factor GreA [Anaerolineae bacterium]|nr:transcription elongation factor GreA [Anaerolineae bacterium]
MDDRLVYLTDAGRERLEKELHYLRTVRRVEISERIREAKREGDVAENAGYESAKHEQAFVEGRIAELEDLLKRAVRIESDTGRDQVTVGCTVTICENGSPPETYRIVGSAEADPTDGSISNECPLGRALLGRRVGDRASFRAPGGIVEVTIVSID